jgi:hypothetical protein
LREAGGLFTVRFQYPLGVCLRRIHADQPHPVLAVYLRHDLHGVAVGHANDGDPGLLTARLIGDKPGGTTQHEHAEQHKGYEIQDRTTNTPYRAPSLQFEGFC